MPQKLETVPQDDSVKLPPTSVKVPPLSTTSCQIKRKMKLSKRIFTSNERIDHGTQSTCGDSNGLQIINYGSDDQKIDISDRIILATKKPIYKTYKDVCSNNIITHRSNTTTHEGNNITHGNTPPVSSK